MVAHSTLSPAELMHLNLLKGWGKADWLMNILAKLCLNAVFTMIAIGGLQSLQERMASFAMAVAAAAAVSLPMAAPQQVSPRRLVL